MLRATPIEGVWEAESTPAEDARGRFARLFCAEDLRGAHGGRPIVQINQSLTKERGSIRGLHFQHPPGAEAKWVRCLQGRVWDVCVDLRQGSPTFLSWHAVELAAGQMNAVFIPEGCAHGFQVLEGNSELLYLHTAGYDPALEGGVRWDDPRLRIGWPLVPTAISARDRNHPLLAPDFTGIEL